MRDSRTEEGKTDLKKKKKKEKACPSDRVAQILSRWNIPYL